MVYPTHTYPFYYTTQENKERDYTRKNKEENYIEERKEKRVITREPAPSHSTWQGAEPRLVENHDTTPNKIINVLHQKHSGTFIIGEQ